MIFKVSFKETNGHYCKAVSKVGRTTTVILKGVVKLPAFFYNIPKEIEEWMRSSNKVELYENVANNTLIVFATGNTKCREDDKYDSLFGERLAEARAKYCIYKFFYDLTFKLYEYYDRILFGDMGVVDSGTGSCIASDMRKYELLCIMESHHIGELLKSKENE